MAQKTVKEVVQNLFTGVVTIEYSDDTTKSFNIDELPVARVESGVTVLKVFGDDIPIPVASDISTEISSAVAGGVVTARNIATITGDYIVGETLTVTLPTGWTGSYQWTRDGSNITDATSSTYLLDAADEAAVVTCNVSSLVFAPVGDTVVAATP